MQQFVILQPNNDFYGKPGRKNMENSSLRAKPKGCVWTGEAWPISIVLSLVPSIFHTQASLIALIYHLCYFQELKDVTR